MKRMKQCKALPQSVSAFAFLLTVAGMNAVNRRLSWMRHGTASRTSMTQFFEHGLGGPGMEGIGIAIAVIGVRGSSPFPLSYISSIPSPGCRAGSPA